MKIQYVGTASSEGLPAIFCRCPVCMAAKKEGERAFRGRSGVCINGKLLLDFPPDIRYSAARVGVDLTEITDIVLTHAHGDHFAPYELSTRREPTYCKPTGQASLCLYGNAYAGELLDEYINGAKSGTAEQGNLRFAYAPSFVGIPTSIGVTVYPLPANHDLGQECRVLLLEETNTKKRFLYAHDTGIFPEETIEFLKGRKCVAISLDCNDMLTGTENANWHMGLRANIAMREKLIAIGAADEHTQFLCSHFSHNGLMENERIFTFSEFENEANKQGFTLAYDGLTIEL